MWPVLFLFVIQAFLDTLQLSSSLIRFSYFLENKNGNLSTTKGRLISQNTNTKGSLFEFTSYFYVDDYFFVFETCQERLQAITELNNQRYFSTIVLD